MDEQREIKVLAAVFKKAWPNDLEIQDPARISEIIEDNQLEWLIFSHEFAKRVWPETEEMSYQWQLHLSRLALADDRIQYLEDHVE